ncbi:MULTISPECIES: GspH/FimT family pseudopilin [unclassified Acinetobacter]|uniref:GspH/FimT family pseudopilin n=1 Tax=unclassified Acinetobacter TaxID=196816 RepID=UPI00044EA308|nr:MULTISPECIES: GspH/FimT family pseudopilin [unclassified Acinetobacter]EZQ11555.1 fimbrial biogenesis protein FimT [Acinetobacter sp. Ver3]
MYSYCKSLAFTLLELIFTIVIISILVMIALPHYHEFRENQERAQILSTVRQAISQAKANAVSYRSPVIICASQDLKSCTNSQWHKGFIIFLDQNHNQEFDPHEKLIQATSTDYQYGDFSWKGGVTSKNTITFQPDSGLPRGSMGHFKYCAHSNKSNLIVRLSMMGQTRLEEAKTCE